MTTDCPALDLVPTNLSSVFFRRAWKQCVFGGLRFMLRHPLLGPPLLLQRLRFPVFKRGITKPVRTPEGFVLQTMLELHLYCNMFVERPLRFGPVVRALRREVNPVILDVGSCLGMFPQWLGGYNSTAVFHCFEPSQMLARAVTLSGQRRGPPLNIRFNSDAVSDKSGRSLFYTGAAGSLVRPARVDSETEVNTIALDDYVSDKMIRNVFLLKIDTDGSNAAVLRGAQSTLSRTRFVIVEKESGILEHFETGWKQIASGLEDLALLNLRIGETSHEDYLWQR